MKKILLSILATSLAVVSFAQGYNAKEGSHRGYDNPRSQQQTPSSSWSGSGIAISQNLFVTNNHVVDGATNLFVYFPETQGRFRAETVAVDETNDLAVVKVADQSFQGFPPIKYGFKTDVEDVGVGVFVLGYPLIDTMGEEVKLTTGVVSSRSGFQGDRSQYQISAPVQPGNSGGPLFNENGELIGIISAKHTEADNVSYGVKLSYLADLVSRSGVDADLDRTTRIASMSLSEKCKAVIPCTVMVLANNERIQHSGRSEAPQGSVNPSSGAYPIHCNMPSISRRGTASVQIDAIEVTSEFTAFYMSVTNTVSDPGYYYIQEDTYIVDKGTGVRYPLLRTENCAVYPKQSGIAYNGTEDFVLYFSALPADVALIDFLEPSASSTWKFYGIRVQ